ncbi:hypothetical protein TNCV_3112221 [Trichonephila clavipes]|nr:hypothetical protein TNCV_3112221 [Trichonephila clavipes]
MAAVQVDSADRSQGAWNAHEIAPALTGNSSSDHNSICRSSVSRPQIGCMNALTWPPNPSLSSRQNRLPSEITTDRYSFLHFRRAPCDDPFQAPIAQPAATIFTSTIPGGFYGEY